MELGRSGLVSEGQWMTCEGYRYRDIMRNPSGLEWVFLLLIFEWGKTPQCHVSPDFNEFCADPCDSCKDGQMQPAMTCPIDFLSFT